MTIPTLMMSTEQQRQKSRNKTGFDAIRTPNDWSRQYIRPVRVATSPVEHVDFLVEAPP